MDSRVFKLRTLLLFTILGCCFLLQSTARPNQTERVSVEDALVRHSFAQLIPIQFSPDGKRLAYTVKDNRKAEAMDKESWMRSGIRGQHTGTDVWIANSESGDAHNITLGVGSNWMPRWSPDGQSLAFFSNRDGSGQARLWIWDLRTNQLRRASTLNVRSDQLEWTPDSKSILMTILPANLSVDAYVEKLMSNSPPADATEAVAESTVKLYHSPKMRQEGEESSISDTWNLNVALRDLAIVDIRTGKDKILASGKQVVRYLVAPDGRSVAYVNSVRFEKPGSQQILYDLNVVELSAVESRIIAAGIRLDSVGWFSWSPDSSSLSYRTGGDEERQNDCYIFSFGRGIPRKVTNFSGQRNRGRVSRKPLWSQDGKEIYFIDGGALWRAAADGDSADKVAEIPGRTIVQLVELLPGVLWTANKGRSTVVITHDGEGKQDGFYRADLSDGKGTKLLEQSRCFTCTNLLEGEFTAASRDGGAVAYFAEDAQHAPSLWVSDPGFLAPRAVTHINPQLEERKLGSSQVISWRDLDGNILHGALLLPAEVDAKKPCPLLVLVYGGATLSDFADHFGWFGFNLQLFTARGYAVLLPDAPLNLGTPMLDLAKTVLPGVNKVIEIGIADPSRLGIMGHSFGGYSTVSLIVQTKRFKAAVEMDGAANLLGFYGEMDRSGATYGMSVLEQGSGRMGGTPWQVRERYVENSPIMYLDRVETPLLIVHGERDSAVASFLADELFSDLRRLGKEVEYAEYMGEDHSPVYWSYANQMDFYTRVIRWFDMHLKADSK